MRIETLGRHAQVNDLRLPVSAAAVPNERQPGREGTTGENHLRIVADTATYIEDQEREFAVVRRVRRRSAGQKGRQCFRVLPSGKHGGRDCPNQQDRFGQISAQGTRIIVEGQKCTILFLLRQNLVITSDDVGKGH